MNWIGNGNILIVGLGLMGGSMAKGLSKKGFHVTAIDKDPDSISYALENGIIAEGYTETSKEVIKSCDACIFALYPGAFEEWVRVNGAHFGKGTYITDVTGVKSGLVETIQDILPEGVEYIAAHPMAGKEKGGVVNSDDSMFFGANYIVTPTENNTDEAINWCKDLARLLGFGHISVLTPKEHDDMIGFVSQLTHCIAVSLMTCSDNRHLVEYTGDSFRDLTRIANINENMWSELFLMNKEPLLKQMDVFAEEFAELRDMIVKDDREGIKSKMRLSTERRSWFDK